MKEEVFIYKNNEYVIFIGTNKHENFELIDASDETDVWFHVENEPSGHLIIKNNGSLRDIPKQVIKYGAYLCKINSKAKTQKQCSIMYTELKNVSKTNVIGQVNVSTYKVVNV
jgi:predicted ribosome quality control (RQC) complex YloA/Tae2 family protein